VPSLVCSDDGKPVSSTRIRRLIAQGDVDEAAMLLGRAHCVVGTVVHGDGRGAGLGIPTANLAVDERFAVPGRGVYAGQVRVDERWWSAAINVGRAPTLRDAGDIRIEAFLLDYAGPEIYGESLCIGFIRRLRNEMRFAGPEALVRQIHRDIAAARAAAEGADPPVC
jgi:riboflavin kinase/FMN adenylyltransferase